MSDLLPAGSWPERNGVSDPGMLNTHSPEPESVLKLVLSFAALIRRHFLIILAITVAAVAYVAYKMRHELPVYRANAVIRLTDKGRELSGRLGPAPTVSSVRPYTDPVLSLIQVLQSRGVAEEVVSKEALQLRKLPSGTPVPWVSDAKTTAAAVGDTVLLQFSDSTVTASLGGSRSTARYGDPIQVPGVQFTVMTRPAISSAQLIVLPADKVASDVKNNLQALPRERTDVVDVSYAATDPQIAQHIVNRAVEVFQSLNASTTKQESVRRRQFIEQQLQKVELMLQDAQDAYNNFRSRQKVYSSQDKFKAQQSDLASIDLRRQELDADRRTYGSLLGTLRQPHEGGLPSDRLATLAASPGIADNSVVSRLFAQLTQYRASRDSLVTGSWGRSTANPDVRRLDALIAAAESSVVDAVGAQVSVLDARIAALDTLKARVGQELTTLPAVQARESALLTQVDTYGREAQRLRDELQSAQIAEAAEAGQVEIVDLATLPGPIGSGRAPKLIFALIVGIGLGTAAAYVLENHRSVIRRRDELEKLIPLPNLALVPQIRGTSNGQGLLAGGSRLMPRFSRNGNGHARVSGETTELVTLSDARSSGAEAYRTLRTNLLFSAAVHAVRRVVVTSPGPEEGKSTTAANLAIAYAQQGHRVLLIDCDLRRSRVHKIFDEASSPGLTNILAAGIEPAEAIRVTRVPGLAILPSGTLPPNPAELLGGSRMAALLDKLAENYDLIIMDTPPLLAASDAAIVSRMADGALVVVRAGRTERSAIQTAVQQLVTVGARVLGTVLNDPDAEVPKYARYYGYYYNNYYEYTNGNGATA